MKLNALTFDDTEELESVTVTMSLKEAIWIAKVSSKQKGVSPHSGIYDCLMGTVFNRLWEIGLEGAERENYVEIPPISYEEV